MNLLSYWRLHTPLSKINRSSRQQISEDIIDLNNIISQLNIIVIYRLLHPTAAAYTIFSSSYATFTNIDHILVYKHKLRKFRRK